MSVNEKVAYCQIDAHLDSNPKIRRAGRDGRDVFEFVLRRVSIARSEGFVPLKYIEPWYLADQLMCSEDEASNGVSRAVTADLLEVDHARGVVQVVGWSPEWGRRPKSNAERQAAFKARKSQNQHESVTESNDESRGVTKVTDQIRSEERRSEREALSRGSESPQRGAAQRQLPADWQPTQQAVTLAGDLGLDTQGEVTSFRLDAKAHGKTAADWDAKFEKWLRGSRNAGKPKPKPGATTRHRKTERIRLENGTYVEVDADGELVQTASVHSSEGSAK